MRELIKVEFYKIVSLEVYRELIDYYFFTVKFGLYVEKGFDHLVIITHLWDLYSLALQIIKWYDIMFLQMYISLGFKWDGRKDPTIIKSI